MLSLPLDFSESSSHKSSNKSEKNSNFLKAQSLRKKIVPLSLPFKDFLGRTIQLLKIDHIGLIGAVLDQENKLILVSGNNIYNALTNENNPEKLITILASSSLKKWDLIFNTTSISLSIWPHLKAAGRLFFYDKKTFAESIKDMRLRFSNMIEYGALNAKHYRAYQIESSGKILYGKEGKPLLNPKSGKPFDHIKDVHNFRRAAKNLIEETKSRLRLDDLKPEERREMEAFLGQVSKHLDESKKFTSKRFKSTEDRQFPETLRKTGLVKSYASSNPDSAISAKGGSKHEIGGVGCQMELIEGLFNTPEALFETCHSFFIPSKGEEAPFSFQEMGQILHELANGIFIHDTVPFFSLHFNNDSNMYPVIHPAYANTLVGQVISMLDYYMKGYLNGGVFHEEFVKAWQENPIEVTFDHTTYAHFVDFKKSAQNQLEGEDSLYVSVRDLISQTALNALSEAFDEIDESAQPSSSEAQSSQGETLISDPIFSDYTKFSNSFRIIACQKKIQKSEDLFVIDADFDVKYTIEPNPDYQLAIDQYRKVHGDYPKEYKRLVFVYEMMAKRIHDHMTKLSLCKKYFEQLKVINFFSYYFMTLKKHGKMPLLPQVNLQPAQSPTLFPSLPILKFREEKIKIKLGMVVGALLKSKKECLKKILKEELSTAEIAELNEWIIELFIDEVSKNASIYLRQEIQMNPQNFKKLCSEVAQAMDLLNYVKVKYEETKSNPLYYFKSAEEVLEMFINRSLLFYISLDSNFYKKHTVAKIGFSHVALTSNQTGEEIESGKRIVGGCGMQVKPKKVEFSSQGQSILNSVWRKKEGSQEGWIYPIGQDIPKGVIFSLDFADIPLGMESKEDLEFFLATDKEKFDSIAKMNQLLNLISSNEEQGFVLELENVSLPQIIDREQKTLLHYSAQTSNLFFTQELIKRGMTGLEKDCHGCVPIHYAAMSGQVEQIKIFLALNGNQIEAKNQQGTTPLIAAIRHQQYAVVEFLIAENANCYAMLNNSYTSIHCAMDKDDLALVKLLLERPKIPISVNIITEEGVTPLMMACRNENFPLVKYLVSKGASAKIIAKNGESALSIAVAKNNLDLCELLTPLSILSANIIETAAKKCDLEINEFLAALPGYLTYESAIQDTPLHMALRFANLSVAEHVLTMDQHKQLINKKNRFSETPLHLAIKGKFYDFVEKLLVVGTVVEPLKLFKLLFRAEYQGQNPLINQRFNVANFTNIDLKKLAEVAIKAGNHMALFKLFPRDLNLDQLFEEKEGWKVMHFLARSDSIFLFRKEYMKSKDPLQSLPNESNKTLPYIAGENGSWRVLSFLLDELKKQTISLSGHWKDRHLFYSVLERGVLEIVRSFVEKINDPQLVNVSLNEKGIRPVHLAAQLDSLDVLNYLHQKGANFDEKDLEGNTSLDIALYHSSQQSIDFLITRSSNISAKSIFYAASLSDDTIFRKLLKAGVNPHVVVPQTGDSALMMAIKQRDQRAFMRLVELSFLPMQMNLDGMTALLIASATGEIEMLQRLLPLTPNPEQHIAHGNNALHLASQANHEHCVKLLLRAGFSLKIKNHLGQTAIDLAHQRFAVLSALGQPAEKLKYERLHEQLIKTIAKQELGLLPKLKDGPLNDYFTITLNEKKIRGTILHHILEYCSKCSYLDLVIQEVMSSRSFNPTLVNSKGESYAHLMIKNGIDLFEFKDWTPDLHVRNSKRQGLLHYAVKGKNSIILEKLLQQLREETGDLTNEEKQIALFVAIENSNYKHIEILLKAGINIDQLNRMGVTPLIFACARGDYLLVRKFIQYGANINKAGKNGITPLKASVEAKHEDIILFLLTHGVNFSLETSIAHLAASKGMNFILKFLMTQGISLLNYDSKGMQPMHVAAAKGKINALDFLSLQGISVDTPSMKREIYPGMEGTTPVLLASSQGTLESVKWLLDHGASSEAVNQGKINIIMSALQNSATVSCEIIQLLKDYFVIDQLDKLLPAVVAAILQDKVEPLKLLYELGVPINSQLENGLTSLHFACRFGALHTTRFLLANGVDCEILTLSNESPLEMAASNKSLAQFKLMLDSVDISLDHVNSKGQTFMHLAVQAGNLSHVIELIDRGADFDIQDFQGKTPLYVAAENGFAEMIRLLMICGADTQLKTFFSLKTPAEVADQEIKKLFSSLELLKKQISAESTPLHIAVKAKYVLAVRLIVRHFDVNQKDALGQTALHYAVQENQLEIVRILLKHNALVDLKNNVGKTVMDLARSDTISSMMIDLLESANAIL